MVGIKAGALRLFYLLIAICFAMPMVLGINCSSCEGCTAAISFAQPGDRIEILSDIYAENSCILIDQENITIDCLGNAVVGNGSSSDYGMLLNNTRNITIRDCRVSGFHKGLQLQDMSAVMLESIISENSSDSAFYIYSSADVTIRDSIARDSTRGLFFRNTTNSSVNGVSSSNNQIGILLMDSVSNDFSTSLIEANADAGIFLDGESSLNLFYNCLFNNTANLANAILTQQYFNTTVQSGPNIFGGPYIGGNFWGHPLGLAYSDTCSDLDFDGFCGSFANSYGIDYHPLSSLDFQRNHILSVDVIGDGGPIIFASIHIKDSEDHYVISGLTNLSGTFRTMIANSSGYTIIVRKTGYVRTEQQFSLLSDMQLGINLSTQAGVIPIYSNFNNSESTDMEIVHDFTDVIGLVLSSGTGSISYLEPVDISGVDLDSNIFFSLNMLSVNISSLPGMNKSATVVMNNVTCPADIFHIPGFTSNYSLIIEEGEDCENAGICSDKICIDHTLRFNVSHFSSFAALNRPIEILQNCSNNCSLCFEGILCRSTGFCNWDSDESVCSVWDPFTITLSNPWHTIILSEPTIGRPINFSFTTDRPTRCNIHNYRIPLSIDPVCSIILCNDTRCSYDCDSVSPRVSQFTTTSGTYGAPKTSHVVTLMEYWDSKHNISISCTDEQFYNYVRISTGPQLLRNQTPYIEWSRTIRSTVATGQEISIVVGISSNTTISSMMINVTYPDMSEKSFIHDMSASGIDQRIAYDFNDTHMPGVYSIMIAFADANGIARLQKSFTVLSRQEQSLLFSEHLGDIDISYIDPDTGEPIFVAYYQEEMSLVLPNKSLDLNLDLDNRTFQVKIPTSPSESLSISAKAISLMLIDDSSNEIGNERRFEPLYSFAFTSNASGNMTVRISYESLDVLDPYNLTVFKADYDFDSGDIDYSSGTFYSYDDPEHPLYINTTGNYVYLHLSSFSSFILSRDRGPTSVPDTEDPLPPSSSGRGGGGTIQPSYFRIAISQLNSMVERMIRITRPGIALTEIYIKPLEYVRSAVIVVSPIGRPSFTDPMVSYAFLNLSATGISSSDLHSMRAVFRVEKSWLEQNGISASEISLYLWNGSSWKEQHTRNTQASDQYEVYRSDLEGFGYLSISLRAEPEVMILQKETIIEDIISPNEDEGSQGWLPPTGEAIRERGEPNYQAPVSEKIGIAVVISMLAAALIIPIILMIVSRGRKQEQLLPSRSSVDTKSRGVIIPLAKPIEPEKEEEMPDILEAEKMIEERLKEKEINIPRDSSRLYLHLMQYIRRHLEKGESKEEVRQRLSNSGWKEYIIDRHLEEFEEVGSPGLPPRP